MDTADFETKFIPGSDGPRADPRVFVDEGIKISRLRATDLNIFESNARNGPKFMNFSCDMLPGTGDESINTNLGLVDLVFTARSFGLYVQFNKRRSLFL